MRAPILRLLADELIVDSFAGGGGASLGIEMALGRSPDIAVNHDPEAIAMHAANHPTTRHYCESVWDVRPKKVTAGRPVGLAWFSPDCKHFSKAKGGKPRDQKVRGLAWVVIRWARDVRPRVIIVENVEEFQTWGPLLEDGTPCPARKGLTFRRWVSELRALGYQVEARELRACDFGAPTTRKRLFVVARCDGQPIVWPEPTHGPGRAHPYRTAAECIDWSLECPSIFERERPLAEATLRRIARGLQRYVIEAREPYIVRIGHTGHGDAGKVHGVGQPLTTIVSKAEHLLVSPTLIQTGYGEREGQAPRCLDIHQPLGTVVAQGQKHALVAAFLARHYGGMVGCEVTRPIPTVIAVDHHSLVLAKLEVADERDGRSSGDDSAGSDRGAAGRDGLEAAEPQCNAVGGAQAGGNEEQARLLGGQGVHREQAVRAVGTSTGLDGRERANSGRAGRESQGRRSHEQLAFEFGAAQPGRQPSARLSRVGQAAGLEYARSEAGEHDRAGQGTEGAGSLVPGDRRSPGHFADAGFPGRQEQVAAFLLKYFGTDQDPRLDLPLHTITTRDRFGLVTVRGEEYAIADIGMRMLAPRELYRAQGFPDSYLIDIEHNGRPLSKTAQVRMCGNSVSPYAAQALVLANVAQTLEASA